MKKITGLAASALLAACLCGCSSNDKSHTTKAEAAPKSAEASPPAAKVAAAAATAVNTNCPYTGAKIDPAVTSEFNGAKIGFCCNGCKGKFDKLADSGKKDILAKAQAK